MKVNFINLTNGIEAIPKLNSFHFIRIQSTACEQKRWDFILQDLDNDFLMNLAIGNECFVYDFGQKGVPRALWQGLKFIEYAVTRCWFGVEIKAKVRGGTDSTVYFREQYELLSERTLKKLEYFKKFLLKDSVCIIVCGEKTTNDSRYDLYKEVLMENII